MNNQGKTAQYANIYLDEDALIVDSNTIMTFSGGHFKKGGFCRYAGGWNVYDCAGQLERTAVGYTGSTVRSLPCAISRWNWD